MNELRPLPTRAALLFGIRYPIVQAGMVWTAGYRLAVAVSEAGALGMIGAGSMKPDLLRVHLRKAREATKNSLAVNIPLMRPDAEELIAVTLEEGSELFLHRPGRRQSLPRG